MSKSTQKPISPDAIAKLAEEIGLNIVDRAELPERMASYSKVPRRLAQPVRKVLKDVFPKGLYTHQARGIDAVLTGSDLCLSTSTASGKSLVFMAAATDDSWRLETRV